MNIPEHLRRPDMTAERKKFLEEWVAAKREIMRGAPTFNTTEEATAEAIRLLKEDELTNPSVWKEPKDIGNKYAVIHSQDRENAYNCGYTEAVDTSRLYELMRGDEIDEIEEV